MIQPEGFTSAEFETFVEHRTTKENVVPRKCRNYAKHAFEMRLKQICREVSGHKPRRRVGDEFELELPINGEGGVRTFVPDSVSG